MIHPELVIVNAAGLTMDPFQTRTTGVAIAQGRIVALGEQVGELIGPSTTVIDAGGKTVMPGFIDAHNHIRLGANPAAVSLFDANSLDDIKAAISQHLIDHPGVEWIEGEGWHYGSVVGGTPTAAMLDDVCSGKPAWIFSYDVHTVWLNSEGLRRWGLDAQHTEVPFGRVELDLQGHPTGWIHDFAVRGIHPQGQRALEAILPGYGKDAQYARVVENLRDANRFGLTTIVEPQNGIDDVQLFERAFTDGELHAQLIAAMIHTPESLPGTLDEIAAFIAGYDHPRITVGPIKLYIDDVIEPHTAAMLAPYANFDGVGSTFWSPDAFASLIVELEERGLQSFVHATGDRGIRTALDGFAAGRRAHGVRDTRHQIVHVECLHHNDIARFEELGVVACMQPRHCGPDIVHEWRANVGEDRERYAWAMKSLIDAGAPVAFSSDWNVAEMDPMVGLYSALTRADLDGAHAWNHAEVLDLDTALAGYTMGSAWANSLEDETGSLTIGKRADVVVLDRDLSSLRDPQELLDTHVTITIANGLVTYSA